MMFRRTLLKLISGCYETIPQRQLIRKNAVLCFTALSFFLAAHSQAFSQLKEVPLPGKSPSTQPKKTRTGTLRTKEDVQPISLPFWDDFSTISDTSWNLVYDTLHWMNSGSVTISNGTGINAPSINVATFNGLNSVNAPYSLNASAKGFADTLLSRPIKLGEPEVPLADRDSVYLSFFYQWRGGQEPPDEYDFLQVEFKNDEQNWVVMETIYGDQNFDGNEFYQKMIKVSDPRFFHNDFQFRFRSFGRLSGPFDSWNVDYIYLNKGRHETETYFPDQAISHPPTSIFGRYRAMPIWQFRSSGALTAPTFIIRNLNNFTDVVNYLIYGTFENYVDTTGIPIVTSKQLGPEIGSPGLMTAYQVVTLTLGVDVDTIIAINNLLDVNDPAQFHPDAKDINLKLKLRAITSDVYKEASDDVATDYSKRLSEFQFKVDFRANDTVSATYRLHDYLAYDDGIAEYSVRLGQPGNRAAFGFDLPVSSDTLTGFYIYFPQYNGPNSQTLDFYIYEDAGGQPRETPTRTLFSRTITKNTTNEFSVISMAQDPVIVQGTFYIGWKEPPGIEPLYVGLDKSQNTSDKLFQNINGIWEAVTQVNGSVMIRPIFGSGTSLPPLGIDKNETILIHPNPNNGTFYMDKMVRDVVIIDVTGKRIGYHLEPAGTHNRVSMPGASSGVYIVRWKEQGSARAKKIIVRNQVISGQ